MKEREKLTWSGQTWLTRERWGSIHPQKPWNWYDPSCVSITGKGELVLSIAKNPRSFFIDEEVITSPYGVGLISSEREFSFGRFEIEAKLPRGRGLWPAFWMYSPGTWPPKIDIFKAYSGAGKYRDWFLQPFKIQTCVHLEKAIGAPVIAAKSPWIWDFNHNPYETFNRYGLIWTRKKLEFYINDQCVRKIDNAEVLDELAGYKMMIIINTHIDGKYYNNCSFDTCNLENHFVLRYFRYYSIEK